MMLGNIIKDLLEQHDMTQKQLAEALMLSPSALGNYIQNIREPDYATLIRIADYFDVTTDFLLDHRDHTCPARNENSLLNVFRSMTEEQQELYLELGKVFLKHNQKKENIHSSHD